MHGFKQVVGITVIAGSLMAASTAHAQIKNYPLHYTGSQTSTETDAGIDIYQQLKQLFGDKVYGYLLENDQFLNFQELVLARFGDKYMVSLPSR